MAHFINDKANLVTDAIEGTIAASGGTLTRLDGFPHIKVVLRTDWDKSRVAIVTGGGSGHEPAHAGFVGRGMVTAAVCGEVFASPSVDAVLAGILAVTGPAGCLLVVKNYTGDRLNFGLAAERARAFGLQVSMVIVDDDIALPDLAQARGLASTLLVHKIAGALAEDGADLETVTRAANRVVDSSRTIGMALDVCTIPGSPKEDRIPEGQAELGLGIHNEPGVQQIAFETAQQAMSEVIAKLAPGLRAGPHVALLNNLGGLSGLEMSILAQELMRSELASQIELLVGPASMMTSLDMRGFSVSLHALVEDDRTLLTAPVDVMAWPGCRDIATPQMLPLPDGLTPIRAMPSAHDPTKMFLVRCCETMIAAEDELNALDAKSGDGDTGSTLANASRALIAAVDTLPLADHTQLFRAIGQELTQTMGGSSGVLLAIFFAAAGDAASSGLPMRNALQAGLRRMQEIGGADLGDRTLVDALAPALDALEAGPQAASEAARKGADATAAMSRANAGRASYVSEAQLQGHTDPGAEAVARLFAHIAG